MYCTQCGKKIEDESRYCKYCGAKIVPVGNRKQKNVQAPEQAMDHYKAAYTEKARAGNTIIKAISERSGSIRQNRRAMLLIPAAVIIAAGIFLCVGLLNRRSAAYYAESEYGKHPVQEYLEMDLNATGGSVIVAPGGHVILSEQNPFRCFSVGDNGVMSGEYYDEGKNVLAIIKDGEIIQISDATDYGILCGSGKKLFYKEDESGTCFSYDTESGENKEIYSGAQIEYVSYDGNVIIFSDGYIKAGSKKPDIGYPFAQYLTASESGEKIYFNSFHTVHSYDENMAETGAESVCDFGVVNAIDKSESNYVIATESSEALITARNTACTEILYSFDGDTYYYNADKKEKRVIASGLTLLPVEEVYEHNNFIVKSVFDPYEYYQKSFVNNPPEFYKYRHSLASIENHIYCAFDYRNCRADLVYMDQDLNMQTLIGSISVMPVIAGGGNYIWTASANSIYRIDLTDKTPEVISCEVDGLGYLIYEEGTYISLPIAVMEDGKTAYCIGRTSLDHDNNILIGSLFKVDFDTDAETVSLVESGVTSCAAADNKVYYTIPDGSILSKLYFCSLDGSKDRIAGDVGIYLIINSCLYFTEENIDEDQSDLFEYKDGSEMIAENVYYNLNSLRSAAGIGNSTAVDLDGELATKIVYKTDINEDEFGDLGIQEDEDSDEKVEVPEADPLLSDAAGTYVFASGSGAWETRFTMENDGSFTGYYSGQDIGPGTMQDGTSYEATYYERHFSGRFSIGKKLGDSTWELILEQYSYEGTDGEERVEHDGASIRYVNTPAPGLEDCSRFVLYGPSTPEDEMPYADWSLFGVSKDYAIGFGDSEMKDVFLRIGSE